MPAAPCFSVPNLARRRETWHTVFRNGLSPGGAAGGAASFTGWEKRRKGRSAGMKKWERILLGCTAAAGLSLGAGAALHGFLLRRGGCFKRLEHSRLYRRKQAEKTPMRHYTQESVNWLQQARRWQLRSEDGLCLRAYYVPAGRRNRTVLLCHGYAGDALQISAVAQAFYSRGYSVLLPDARGHGCSEGRYIGMGWPERRDVCGWIGLLLEKEPETEIALYGLSMGAATVMAVSGEQLPAQVKCIVEDCGYASVWKEFLSQLPGAARLLLRPLLQLASVLNYRREGFFFQQADISAQVAKCRVPLLFIHGKRDQFVPYGMLQELYDAAACPKEKLEIEGAGHTASMIRDPALYWQTVDAFLARYMPAEDGARP